MRILVAIEDLEHRRRLAALLVCRGHAVNAVGTVDGALKACAAGRFEVALLGWRLVMLSGRELAEVVGACKGPHRTHVLAVVPQTDPEIVRALFAAAVDDFMTVGACAEEVVGRAEAPQRQRDRDRAVLDFCDVFTLDRLSAWNDLGGVASSVLSEMLGIRLRLAPEGAISGTSFAAEMPVTMMSELVEMNLAMGVDQRTAALLGSQLFGGPVGPEVIGDALREMTNVVGGAFKRAAMSEGAVFALGLPVDRSPLALGAPEQREWMLCGGPGLTLAFAVRGVVQAERAVPVRDLHEGMVLANDVRNSGGIVLLTAGSVLTERTARRLGEMMALDAVVSVGVAA